MQFSSISGKPKFIQNDEIVVLDPNLQMFPVSTEKRLKVLKIVFVNSTDFFGRITIYNLEVLGAFLWYSSNYST